MTTHVMWFLFKGERGKAGKPGTPGLKGYQVKRITHFFSVFWWPSRPYETVPDTTTSIYSSYLKSIHFPEAWR